MKFAHHLTTLKPAVPSTWKGKGRKQPKGQEWRNLFTRTWGRTGRRLKDYRKRGRR